MSEYAIETRGLGKTYPHKKVPRRAVDDLNLKVPTGQIFGLLGPNGAGKTTTLRMFCGLLVPTNGEVFIGGVSVARDPTKTRGLIGFVPEDAGHHKNLSIKESLAFYGSLYGLGSSEVASRSAPILKRLGIADRANDRLGTFSKGMRRKVHLARALLHHPRILVLDEPTDGLDPAVAEEVWELLKQEVAAQGTTIIICSHHLEEVERLCQRIGILKQRLLLEGELAEIAGNGGRHRILFAGPAEVFANILNQIDGVSNAEAVDNELYFNVGDRRQELVPEAVRRLAVAGAPILSIQPVEKDLRAIYRSIVRDEDAAEEAVA